MTNLDDLPVLLPVLRERVEDPGVLLEELDRPVEVGATGTLSIGLTLVVINSLGEPGLAFGTLGNASGTICTTAPSWI